MLHHALYQGYTLVLTKNHQWLSQNQLEQGKINASLVRPFAKRLILTGDRTNDHDNERCYLALPALAKLEVVRSCD